MKRIKNLVPANVLVATSLWAFSAGLIVVGGVLFAYWFMVRDLPEIITIADYQPPLVTQILAKENDKEILIGEYYKERRYLLPFVAIPKQVIQAFIAAEDDQFYEHEGLSLLAIVRAAIANAKAGHVVQGGSTITQQVAKSLFLTPERTLTRKIKEAVLAYRVEKNLSKEDILYLYLNQIYLGHGAYGIEAASQSYFRKKAEQISLAEAALLAAMPRAPSVYNPLSNPEKAKELQKYVLRRMFENKFISEQEMAEAGSKPVKIYLANSINERYSPYFVEQVRRKVLEKYGEQTFYEGGLRVHVTSQPKLLREGRASLREGLRQVDRRRGYRGPVEVLGTAELREAFVAKNREEFLKNEIQFKVLKPDGTLSLEDSVTELGLTSIEAVLAAGDRLKGLVSQVDDASKLVVVDTGLGKGTIPFAELQWALPENTDENPRKISVISKPSQVVKVGHVVWVKVMKNEGTPRQLVLSLDQEPVVEGAVYSIETRTGKILSMEGGYDHERSEFNRAIQAKRQPGSAFKPVIFAAAMEKGFTPATIIVDSPIVFRDEEIGTWRPSNFKERFYGDTLFREVLIHSRNVPTIKIVQAIKIPTLMDFIGRIGLVGEFNSDLSLSLGSGSVTLMDLTHAYALFSRLGSRPEPYFVEAIYDRHGQKIEETKPVYPPDPKEVVQAAQQALETTPTETAPEETQENPQPALLPPYPLASFPNQPIDPRIAYLTTHLMESVVESGTGAGAKALGKKSAGKTGTTNDSKDAWYVGYTPTVLTSVWVGFDDSRISLGSAETGANAALPIWLRFMKLATQAEPPDAKFTVPPGIVFSMIDPQTGRLAQPRSPTAVQVAFLEGTEPTERSTSKQKVESDSQGDFLKQDFE